MTPFQSFRLWARRAPGPERVSAGLATVAALAALIWLLVPAKGHPARVATAGAATAGAAGSEGQATSGPQTMAGGWANNEVKNVGLTNGTGGASPSGAVGASASGGPELGPTAAGNGVASRSGTSGGAGTNTATGHACVTPPGTAPGVTATEIKIAVSLTDLVGPAGNSTFGLPTPQQQESYYQAVIASINSAGGVACRTLVPSYYDVNSADQSSQQSECLDMIQSGAFAALDFTGFGGSTPQAVTGPACFAQAHVPFFEDYFEDDGAMTKFYPYVFALNTYESLYYNTILGLQQRGFFSPGAGFRKLGFIYRSCYPNLISDMNSWFQHAGLSSSQIVRYDLGCPAAFAAPSDLEQAILKFQQAGVTNVTWGISVGDFANFTTIAEQQNFRPKYGIGDDGTINVSYGSSHPDYNNIVGAVAITAGRYGEEHTPGMVPTGATARCNAIFAKAGLPPVYQQPIGAGGNICDQLWMFAAAVDHAPVLSQSALAAGLQAAKSVNFSYPQGPNDFSGYHVAYGGQYWRTDGFFAGCSCWRVIDPVFHPGR